MRDPITTQEAIGILDELKNMGGVRDYPLGRPSDLHERVQRLEYALIDIRQSISLLIEVLKR